MCISSGTGRDLLPSTFIEPDTSSQESEDEVDQMVHDEDMTSTNPRKRKEIPGDLHTKLKPAKVARVSDSIPAVDGWLTYFFLEIMALTFECPARHAA